MPRNDFTDQIRRMVSAQSKKLRRADRAVGWESAIEVGQGSPLQRAATVPNRSSLRDILALLTPDRTRSA